MSEFPAAARDWESPQLRQVLDQLSHAVIAVDNDFRYVFANKAALKMVGRTLDEVVGQNHWELLPQLKNTKLWEIYNSALQTKIPTTFEYQSPLSSRWYLSEVHPSEGGMVFHLIDITDRVTAERARSEREQELRDMVDSIPQIAWSAGPDRVPAHLNGRWFEYTGLNGNSVQDFASVVYPEDLSKLYEELSQLHGKTFEGEGRLRRYDGAYRWHLIRNIPRFAASGELVGYFGTSTDIHDLKLAEEILRETTDTLPALVFRLDSNLRYTFCNLAYERWVNRSRSEILGAPMSEVSGDRVFQVIEPYVRRALEGEAVSFKDWVDYPLRGSRFMEARFVPIKGGSGVTDSVIAMVQDSTHSRLAQEALAASEERFRSVIEVGLVPMAFYNRDGAITEANQAFLDLVGFSRTDLGKGEVKWSELTPPKWTEITKHAMVQFEEEGRIAPYEKEYFRKDGTKFWGLFGGVRLGPNEGLSYILDITARKEAEEVAQTQLRITQTIAENATSAIMLTDVEGRATYANSAFYKLTQYNFSEILGKTGHDLIHYKYPDGRPFPREECELANAQANSQSFENIEVQFVRKDGSIFPVVASLAPLKGDQGIIRGSVLEFRDVTQERARERTLTFLAALGEATRQIRDPDQIMRISSEMLGKHVNAARCAYCEVEEDQDTLVNIRDWSPRLPSIEGAGFVLSHFGPFVSDPLLAGKTVVAEDLMVEAAYADATAFAAIQVKALVASPLLKDGRLIGIMAVLSDAPRRWTDEEISLVKLVIERCWAEIERARAERGLRESERRLLSILEAATIGVIVNDRRGRFTYANAPLLEMLGYRKQDIDEGNLSWRKIQVPERMAKDDLALDQLRINGSCLPYETELVKKDGERISVYVGAAFIPDEAGEGLMGAAFITDLTPLKAAQDELEQLNSELDQRVRDRTSELKAANQALETYSHHVAHDLRAPLRSIASTSRILEEDFGDVLPNEAREMLRRQDLAANKLGKLIDDLLKISRLSREEMTKEPVDLTEIGHSVTVEALSDHPHTEVKVIVEEGLESHADPKLIRLALLNLIENAVKYSPRGGIVRFGKDLNGDFFVSDEGIGFDMAYVDKIFEPFQRLHNDGEFKGNGVGLSNVRQVIERHGGCVRAESTPGNGSTFYFTLESTPLDN